MFQEVSNRRQEQESGNHVAPALHEAYFSNQDHESANQSIEKTDIVQEGAIDCPMHAYSPDTYLEKDTSFERVRAHVKAPYIWTKGALYNAYNIARIVDASYVRPFEGGLVDTRHPWCTGKPTEKEPLRWHDNVIFRTEPDKQYAHTDEKIVEATGKFLCGMVKKSASSERHPEGAPRVDEHGTVVRRLPHAINYIHGSSHYNAGWMIFNNFEEAFHYFNTKDFRDEVRRFVEEEGREITIVFREKDYSPKEFGQLGCMLRTAFKWYSNTNGPVDTVHWGSKVPFATINMITGKFFKDLIALKEGNSEAVVRAPIQEGKYFQEGYTKAVRTKARPAERLFARALNMRLQLRSAKKGNLFFVNKPWIDKKKALQKAPVVGRIDDQERGRSWTVRRQSFHGRTCDVHDLSRVSDHEKNLMPLPPDYNSEQDALLVFDGDTHHTYVKLGNQELHGTMFYRRKGATITTHDTEFVKGHTAVVIKGSDKDRIAEMKERMQAYAGAGSLSCSQLAHEFLKDSGIHLKRPARSSVAVHSLFDGVLEHGFVDADGQHVPIQILRRTQDQSLEEVSQEIKYSRDWRFAALAPLGLLRGMLQRTLNHLSGQPRKTVLGL